MIRGDCSCGRGSGAVMISVARGTVEYGMNLYCPPAGICAPLERGSAVRALASYLAF
jgi:hypothetical protein